jgi:hypothetical protein
VPPRETSKIVGADAASGEAGRRLTFTMMPARRSVGVQARLARTALPILLQAAPAVGKGGDEQAAAATKLVASLTSELKVDDVTWVMDEVLTSVLDDKRAPLSVESFDGEPAALIWEVLAEALRWNYASFFRGSLFGSIREEIAKIASRQSSPPTSTPSGTDPSSPSHLPSAPSGS